MNFLEWAKALGLVERQIKTTAEQIQEFVIEFQMDPLYVDLGLRELERIANDAE